MRTRKTHPEDVPALKALWQEAFGDSAAEIDQFFDALYPAAIGFCAEEAGEVRAMLFALPQTIVKDEKQLKSAYLYAVATAAAYRGQGLCRALLAYAEKELRKRYFEAVMLSPATPELARFYASLGYQQQRDAQKTVTACQAAAGEANPATAQDYAGLRETLLWDTAHVRFDKAQLEYAMAGAQAYCLMAGYDMGCAIAAPGKDGAPARVRELLPSERVLPALAEKLGAGEYEISAPCTMLKWLGQPYPALEPVYLGLALD